MRQAWFLLLAAILLLAAMVGIGHMLPPEQKPDKLTVLVLRPGEGNAALVTCGGQTLLLPLGDSENTEDLAAYLKMQQLLHIDHIAYLSEKPFSAALTEQLSEADVIVIDAETASVSLGTAICRIEPAAEDTISISVTHRENNLRLVFFPESSPGLLMNDEQPTELNTAFNSVRIISDGVRFKILPDFSALED